MAENNEIKKGADEVSMELPDAVLEEIAGGSASGKRIMTDEEYATLMSLPTRQQREAYLNKLQAQKRHKRNR